MLFRRYVRFAGENPAATRLMHNMGAKGSDELDRLYETYLRPIQDTTPVARCAKRRPPTS